MADTPQHDDDTPIPGAAGPHPLPWPEDARLDPVLLRDGDARNVVDRFRYWRVDAIREELDRTRHAFHVVLENWDRDPNIGAAVRNANAFGAAAVHIVGRRKWNRRGAMMTEVYQHVHHHDDAEALLAHAAREGLPVLGVDNVPGAVSLYDAELPRACMMVFGQERTGLSPAMRAAVRTVVAIAQYGSTRSINAGAASAVAMFEWCRRHAARDVPLVTGR